ncbi:8747_t:CDS:2 [Paraglomus brasilianum]|uniref:8747_t:CDS:1 n=1 Tax=Paraglomus brasilianum TaxID=144538 RepID=A0A9N9AB83_9GLOM|nr:8747_t:CDS:2 [Paraglomus brasilianum]
MEDSPPRKVRRTRAQERPKAVRRVKSRGQSEDKMTTHAKSPLAPVVPQPICVCCGEVQAPDARSTATLVSPVRVRASAIVKGRDRVHRMIRCNFCTKWYHLACMNPPTRTMPSSGYIWRCEDCEKVADKPGEATDSNEDSRNKMETKIAAEEKNEATAKRTNAERIHKPDMRIRLPLARHKNTGFTKEAAKSKKC